MKTTNTTLQAIDFLIEDFGVEGIAEHFRDVFKTHLRGSEGYNPEALADEYEIGNRLIEILKERKAYTDKEKRKKIAKKTRKTYEKARAEAVKEKKEGI